MPLKFFAFEKLLSFSAVCAFYFPGKLKINHCFSAGIQDCGAVNLIDYKKYLQYAYYFLFL
jgi:hypothetical protein